MENLQWERKKDGLEGERPIGVRAIKVGGKDLGITREGEGEGRTVGRKSFIKRKIGWATNRRSRGRRRTSFSRKV
jgi:hypothetical protein